VLSIATPGNYNRMRRNSPLHLLAVSKLSVHAFGSSAIASSVAVTRGFLHCGLSPVKRENALLLKKKKKYKSAVHKLRHLINHFSRHVISHLSGPNHSMCHSSMSAQVGGKALGRLFAQQVPK